MASYMWRKYADYVYTKWERMILWNMVEPYTRHHLRRSFLLRRRRLRRHRTALQGEVLGRSSGPSGASYEAEVLRRTLEGRERRGSGFSPASIDNEFKKFFQTTMTTYGTIPTEPFPSVNSGIISRAKEQLESYLGIQRPWQQMFQLKDFRPASSLIQSFDRTRTNIAYFRTNYAIIVLAILCISLLWHPMTLLVMFILVAAWWALYYLRGKTVAVFGRELNHRLMTEVLILITVIVLLFTNVKSIILMAVCIGLAFVLVHGALREPGDVFIDEERSGLGSGQRLPLRNAASSSYSLSQ